MVYVATISIVLSLLCAVAFYKALTVKTKADFFVAGRSLSWPVLVFTLLSSWIGAGSLLGGAENAYRNGFAALWQPAGGLAGLIIISLIAGRARRFAQYTVPDLLEARYSPLARVLATIAIVLSYTVITSYQFKGGGDILHLIFPTLSRVHGMYIVALFVIIFTASAGMASVAYLDLIIGSLTGLVILISVPVLVARAGGWAAVHASLPASHFQLLGTLSFSQCIGLLLPTMLLLVGNQGMYQKFFSARTERDARYSVYGWIVGTVLLETALVTLAVVASAFLHTDHPREIIPLAAKQGLPAFIGAALLGGVFAKIISTANNYLFSPATNLIHDVYGRFVNPNATQKQIMLLSRVVVLLLGVFALLQATQFESVLQASLYAYTIYGAAVTPSLLAVFFWERTTNAGAVSSIVLGTLVTVLWNQLGRLSTWPVFTAVDAVFPALCISVSSLVLVSLVTSAPTLHPEGTVRQ